MLRKLKGIGYNNRFKIAKGETHPNNCVYFLADKDQNLLYIGQTGNLQQRLSFDYKFSFDKVFYISESEINTSKLEQILIYEFKPKHNVQGTYRNTKINEIQNNIIKDYIKSKSK